MGVMAEILRIVKLMLVGVIIGGSLWLWFALTGESRPWAKDYGAAVSAYNEGRWSEAVANYDLAWARHPDNKGVGAKEYAEAAQKAGDKGFEVAVTPGAADSVAEKGQSYEDALFYYERAQANGVELNDRSLEHCCDAYIQVGQFDQARKIIARVKQKGNFAGSRFATLEAKIARYDK